MIERGVAPGVLALVTSSGMAASTAPAAGAPGSVGQPGHPVAQYPAAPGRKWLLDGIEQFLQQLLVFGGGGTGGRCWSVHTRCRDPRGSTADQRMPGDARCNG
jgi:hypothetical protein